MNKVRWRVMIRIAPASLLLVLAAARAAAAAGGVTPGKLVVERPTLICLGFEWRITGDDNRNAAVEVTFRRTGETAWRDALPLLRIGGER
ncbi:MAG: hypothetical protein DMG07_13665, partial [Acidobacteria bacterium]